MILAPLVDHATVGMTRLATQYQGKPYFAALLRVLFRQCQDLEEAGQQLLALRSVDAAEGEQLSVLERIVGQPRLSTDTAVRRAYIKARIAVNRSSGTADELLQIMALVLPAPQVAHLVEHQPAAILVSVAGGAVTDVLALVYLDLLKQAKAAGVRLVFEYEDTDDASAFHFDTGPGFDVGHLAAALV